MNSTWIFPSLSAVDLDVEILKTYAVCVLGSCRYKLPEIHEDQDIYVKIFEILNKLNIDALFISAEMIPWTRSRNCRITQF